MWWRRRLFSDIEELEREINRALEEFLYERPMWDLRKRRLEPLSQVIEEKNNFIVTVDLPNVRREDISLNVTENTLEVDARMQSCVRFDRWGTTQRECEFESFRKLIKLPSRVIVEGTTAKFKHGVLVVKLPKKLERHKIEVE
ncbi:MAG: Hsp20/alpha crystallin family protein [Candidatus Bathyarchaeia archaeon]